MKRWIAFLLCCVILILSASCRVIEEPSPEPPSLETDAPKEEIPPIFDAGVYNGVLDLYARMLTICHDYGVKFFTVQSIVERTQFASLWEKQIFEKMMPGISTRYRSYLNDGDHGGEARNHFGYAIKDFNGDGIDELVLLTDGGIVFGMFSVSEGKPRLLWTYGDSDRCWFDEDGLFYTIKFADDAISTDYYRIQKITDEGKLAFVLEIGDAHRRKVRLVDNNVQILYTRYRYVDGKRIIISESEYRSLLATHINSLPYSGMEAVLEYIVPAMKPAFSDFALSKQTLIDALNNDEVLYYHGGFLSSKRVPTEDGQQYLLSDLGSLFYAFLDVDGDGIEEAVVDYGDGLLVLRYYKGRVYDYIVGANGLYTDGSYNWSFNGQNAEYGENRLTFDGAELKTVELWRIVNDGAPDAEYYLNGESVSRQVLLQYFEDTVKEACVLASLSVPWSYNISYYDAIEIAKEYWKAKEIDINAYVVIYDESYRFWQSSTYVILLGQPTSDGYTAIERVRISKNTGQIDLISDIVDGKG